LIPAWPFSNCSVGDYFSAPVRQLSSIVYVA
jgi:hypothetical protein